MSIIQSLSNDHVAESLHIRSKKFYNACKTKWWSQAINYFYLPAIAEPEEPGH